MPSWTSMVVSKLEEDSMLSTPSAPTLSRASAIMSPMASSFPAEMDATALMSSLPSMGLAFFLSSVIKNSHALSIPFFTLMGFAPLSMYCRPYLMSSLARTLAVVVPSPAVSFAFPATSLMSCAPAFSTGQGKSMALAMDTPSLMTSGFPYDCSRTTFLPLGPSVTLTASASLLIPSAIFFLLSLSNLSSLGSARTTTEDAPARLPPWRSACCLRCGRAAPAPGAATFPFTRVACMTSKCLFGRFRSSLSLRVAWFSSLSAS
mmetsp:Transcript_13114/g.27682  ORF Transcript_13114/g.27682 Transcript_13114/m.27682 type:complete len:262 (-) Transcript_13114:18-803(-)